MKNLAALLVILSLAGLTACGSDESREDADDTGNGQVEKDSPNVAAFNNHFGNVQHKCLYDKGAHGPKTEGTGLRVVQTSDGHGSRMVVIPDPHCSGYLPEQGGTVGVGGNQP